ncbi:MAG TPA: carboxylating nicotinate-nucleotide diphosphorylase [Nitrospirota bacterium]|nr:carboxylating nicotinate-nucleotide diphosphorylase [Nitrospirota bacterium]
MKKSFFSQDVGRIVAAALSEDIGPGDITTSLLIPEDKAAEGIIRAEEEVLLAGIWVAEEVFRTLDPGVEFEAFAADGDLLKNGDNILHVRGKARALLTGERVALNFLQRLSGVASLSRRYAEAVKGLPVRIVDTRKTTPGLRGLEKYAVRVGGCWNHRYGLFDGVLIKENHIALTPGVAEAIFLAKGNVPHTLKVEVEVRNLEEVREAIRGGADIVMLDNMDIPAMREAVCMIRSHKERKILIEASGGMSLDHIREVAVTDIDLISAGALTHSASWLNISMDIYETD